MFQRQYQSKLKVMHFINNNIKNTYKMVINSKPKKLMLVILQNIVTFIPDLSQYIDPDHEKLLSYLPSPYKNIFANIYINSWNNHV